MTTQQVLRIAGRVKPVFGIFLAFLLIGFNFRSYAKVTIHQWLESHRGYSIENIPGTDEYVAAGTVYDINRPNETGWHYMHLSNAGYVLDSRISWSADPSQQLRVVDIAVQSNDEFRITIQGRLISAGSAQDYVYIHGVHLNGTDLVGQNPAIAIFCNGPDMINIYPTNSYYANNSLFICGYAADNSQYPNDPQDSYGSKYGMIMKVDVNAPTVTHNETFWTSTSYTNSDFDMALHLSPYSANSDFPLLLVGACNEGSDVSEALVAKIDNTGAITALQGVNYTYSSSEPVQLKGIFAVDARAQVAGVDNDGDIVLLVNNFDDVRYAPFTKRWGYIRIHDDLTTYPIAENTTRWAPGLEGWANQFANLHMSGGNPVGDHVDVIGQQYNNYNPLCVTLPANGLSPSNNNIDPFIAEVSVGNGWWMPGSGYVNTGAGPIFYRYFYATSQGTKATNLNYLPGSLSYGSALEDVSRLYTFAAFERYYDVVQNQALPTISMVAPFGENPTIGNNNLITKFIKLNTSYEETECQTHTSDCIKTNSLAGSYNWGDFTYPHENCVAYDGYTIFTLSDEYGVPQNDDCSASYYKPSAIKASYLPGNLIKIYPNPASEYLNIQFGEAMAGKSFEFTLLDMTGKIIYSSKGQVTKDVTKISLPGVSAGMYMATVLTEGKKEMKKITIQ